MVRDMLAELPQVTSIEEGFASLEDRIDQISQHNSDDTMKSSDVEQRIFQIEKNYEQLKSQLEVNKSVCPSTCTGVARSPVIPVFPVK